MSRLGVARSQGQGRQALHGPLLVVEHVEVVHTAVAVGIVAVRVVVVGLVAAPDRVMRVGGIANGSPSKELAKAAWRTGVNVVLLDPTGDFDHLGIVVEGDRLPLETSEVLTVGLDLVVQRLYFGPELLDVEGEGFTDNGGNGVVRGCRRDHLLRTG